MDAGHGCVIVPGRISSNSDITVDQNRSPRKLFCKYGCRMTSPILKVDRVCKVEQRKVHCKKCELSYGGSRSGYSTGKHQNEDIFVPSKFRRRKMRWAESFFILLCFVLICDAKSSTKGAPPRVERPRTKFTATVGQQRVVLPCEVTADPTPLISWTFNGKPITLKSRLRDGFSLRIKNVEAGDAGRYVCTATNAFGSVTQEVNLIVNDVRGRSQPARPRFTMPSKMLRRNIAKPANSFLKLRCAASGSPAPKIEWFKDGNLTQPPGGGRRPVWTYKIKKLQRSDSGTYKCRVWNSEGEISYTYDVSVVEPLRERPVLLEPHPMNTTVQVGGMTAIQCRVQSRVQPTVKWIKRLDNKAIAAYHGKLPNSIITIDGRHYLILPTQEMLPLPNGSYLNKLVIRGATERHAGMYICLAANTMGYNFRYAYLNVVTGPMNSSLSTVSPRTKVLPGSRSQNAGSSTWLPVMISVPAGIGLLIVLLVAWCCLRNKEQRFKSASSGVMVSRTNRLSALGSSETKSSTRSTPIPNEYEPTLGEDNNNKGHALDRATDAYAPGRNFTSNYYVHNTRPPPTVGTPLLTVAEPDDSEFKSPPTDDDTFIPNAPPCSEITSPCSTERRLTFKVGLPPAPPPSQKSTSSLSSYPDMRPQHRHHYHYMHPPGNSRRHHHHHSHHSRSGHHHYGY